MMNYVVRNRYSRAFINSRAPGEDVTARFKNARKFESLDAARDVQQGNLDHRDILRVSYVLRWHENSTGEVFGYEDDECGGAGPKEYAKRYASAEEARAAFDPWFFDRNSGAAHLRVVRVLTKVKAS